MAAILFGNHILDTFGLTARIFVSHPVPLDFRAPNSAPRIHTRLRTPAAVVSPPPAAPETPSCPEATSALLPGFFHPRLRAPATVVQRPGCTRGPILHGALPRGDFCLAVRQHLKRPPPRSRDIRSQTRRSKNEAGAGYPHRRNRLRPIHIRVSSGFAEPRGPPGFTHRPAPYPAIPAAGPAPVRTVYLRLVRCCASCWRRSSS